ncbi:MAG: hypothetical protein COW00_13505 [Bdellovibrio sp. CG12_big_fil_rev_8_21_14_0_65_39_13]|nr:MAG: hypothetical protein COW00_13505 [Bdellovibrio sp. CG12_big_fil_rev_8_21_14_0_65_39_13]PIR34591.1 MAG: hypothetical protein COV37_12515 [Bdellovibrio sp. CG11_big_fil_rev_8_21_14_0_20_39_38]
MAKSRKKTTKASAVQSKNITKDKLKGTPFSTAEELKKAQAEILEDTWRRLEKAKAKRELTKKEEYSFFVETFRKGMVCKYGEKDDNLVRVSLDEDSSVKISISEDMRSKENSEHLLGVLIESMSSSFLTNYLKAMDIVEDDTEIEEQLRRVKSKMRKNT